MRKVVPKIQARTPDLPDQGNLLDNYIFINQQPSQGEQRPIEGDCGEDTQPTFLWRKPFVQMPAKVVSGFADRRTYRFQGKEIDRQDHLGFDLASVRHAKIPAANDGIVVMAEYLGIYGNTVVIDHGLGLMSLYAHCSSVTVNVGDRVERAQVIGSHGRHRSRARRPSALFYDAGRSAGDRTRMVGRALDPADRIAPQATWRF